MIAAVAAVSVLIYRKNNLRPKYLKVRSQRKYPHVETFDHPHDPDSLHSDQ